MVATFSGLRDLSAYTIVLRMTMAAVCGGIIGIERALKHRPAGLRTHILICVGAAMTTLTGLYLGACMGYDTDVARLGAQVIAGVGFIGTGTIIVTRRHRVKGLTTAAGLWVSAIIGLTLGAGYYEAGICATALVMIAEIVFFRLEHSLLKRYRDICLYIACKDTAVLDAVIQLVRENEADITDLEINHAGDSGETQVCAVFVLQMQRRSTCRNEMASKIRGIPGVVALEEM